MKCSNCNQENNTDALFCTSCGAELNNNGNQAPQPTFTINNNSNRNKPKKNKWLIIGLVALFVVGFIIIVSGDDSSNTVYNSGYSVNDQEKFGEFLVDAGFTRKSSTVYTFYNKGYLYTFDFAEDIFSQESDTMYNAYFYKKDIFGTAMVSDSLELTVIYDFNSYNYSCEVKPASYQSYTCSYMKSTITELAATIRSTFYSFVNEADVSVSNL